MGENKTKNPRGIGSPKPIADRSVLEIAVGSLLDVLLTVIGRKDLAIARHRRPIEDRCFVTVEDDAVQPGDPRRSALVMIAPDADFSVLTDVRPIAQRLANVLGIGAVARLVDMDPVDLSDFLAGRREISGATATRLIDAEFLLSRVAQVFVGRAGTDWLLSSDVRHSGARRIDVFATAGLAPIIEDLERLAEGSCA